MDYILCGKEKPDKKYIPRKIMGMTGRNVANVYVLILTAGWFPFIIKDGKTSGRFTMVKSTKI